MARYDDTVLVFVTPISGTQVKYGFRTTLEANYRTQLSHTLVDLGTTFPVGLVIGANAPKPPKASKLVATGTKSSFVLSQAGSKHGRLDGELGRLECDRLEVQPEARFITSQSEGSNMPGIYLQPQQHV
ncbi:MAG: hypothetical protein HC840_24065 [Leptolyngbyaceae cyanobacterium RM2_2_4]|nr:hypothetical protein [Leptolyngbyaceae cyanobacterium RM2_2_4]